ncbi:MAG: hypothetical protein Q9216_003924, partial [Gyalolechia sp. 2 TL-2023]
MPSPYSPYVIHQAGVPDFKPGEYAAASAFIGMTLLLVVEVNVEVFRIFKRRTGLYYWSITIGSFACGVNAIGIILKFLTPGAQRIWVFYVILTCTGWASYTVAQLLVLYSRLHLVTENYRLRRKVLWLICVVSPVVIVADWIVVLPAWNTWDWQMSERWSAPSAIVERIAQLAFTLVEVTISAVYVHALGKLLRVKSSVRTRRVMWDLNYVVILGVVFDIINVILVFVNRVGLSHPIQTFTYALKLRLEFAVLNQLMAVAARGLQHKGASFAEKRYHNPPSPTSSQSFSPLDPTTQHLNPSSTSTSSPAHTVSTSTSPPAHQLSVPDTVADHPFHKYEGGNNERVRSMVAEYDGEKEKVKEKKKKKVVPDIPPRSDKDKGRGNRTLWRNEEDLEDEEEKG